MKSDTFSMGYIDRVSEKSGEERAICLENLPPLKINKYFHLRGERYPILRLVWIQQSKGGKVILLEELGLKRGKELRIRYYIIGGKDKRMAGKWTYGQFAPIAPPIIFRELFCLARKYKILS